MSKGAIVCVDDERIVLISLRDQLKRYLENEYEIELAESGEEALEIFAELQEDDIEIPLIISDQIMPGMKGDELLVEVHSRYPKTLKILLTGQASADAVGNAVNAANLYRYIAKPWDAADLCLTVTEALRSYDLDKQLAEQNEALKKINDELKQFNVSLEQKVAERTAELSITNRQLQAEIADRQLLEEKLRTSERKMRGFFEAMTTIILILDIQDNTIENIEVAPTNPGRLYAPDIDPISETIGLFFNDEKSEVAFGQIRQALETQQTVNFDYTLSLGKDEFWFTASIAPISDSSIIWVARDITARKKAEEALRKEQEKSEQLLLNILPRAIAQRLKQDQQWIAEHFDDVTILFADIVGFTPLSAHLEPIELVNLLNQIFSDFDQLAQRYGVEKIKTIGDAYMVVGGLPLPMVNHAEAIAQMALDMQQVINRYQTDKGYSLQIRIGINTGSVVAGVIGRNKFIYDLWGDAVNVASRMESSGVAGRIQVTSGTCDRLKAKYVLKERGMTFVKGKGEMITYWLTGRKLSNPLDVKSETKPV
ncbi:MAG TPA: adenylate/guanylate cyclase domain-containing protein [Chroococcales cyanobacterium]|jgi:class 3 adenylate cyclase/DNA-binding response OmpR family regulator